MDFIKMSNFTCFKKYYCGFLTGKQVFWIMSFFLFLFNFFFCWFNWVYPPKKVKKSGFVGMVLISSKISHYPLIRMNCIKNILVLIEMHKVMSEVITIFEVMFQKIWKLFFYSYLPIIHSLVLSYNFF